jgi:DNA-binding Lrp family transcriptional regulator
MGNKLQALDAHDQRILAHMRRAPTGHYTEAQLARNTGLPLPEVQRRLTQLRRAGAIVRSLVTISPTFQLAAPDAAPDAAPVARARTREAADRPKLGRAR